MLVDGITLFVVEVVVVVSKVANGSALADGWTDVDDAVQLVASLSSRSFDTGEDGASPSFDPCNDELGGIGGCVASLSSNATIVGPAINAQFLLVIPLLMVLLLLLFVLRKVSNIPITFTFHK